MATPVGFQRWFQGLHLSDCYWGDSQELHEQLLGVGVELARLFMYCSHTGIELFGREPGQVGFQELLLPGMDTAAYVADMYKNDPFAAVLLASFNNANLHDALDDKRLFDRLVGWCLNQDPVAYLAKVRAMVVRTQGQLDLLEQTLSDSEETVVQRKRERKREDARNRHLANKPRSGQPPCAPAQDMSGIIRRVITE